MKIAINISSALQHAEEIFIAVRSLQKNLQRFISVFIPLNYENRNKTSSAF